MDKRHFCTILTIISVILTCAPAFSTEDKPHGEPPESFLTKEDIFYELGLFADVITLIDANYVKKIAPKDMIYGALKGMLSSLDSHSSFLTPEEYKDLKTDTFGEFGGVGLRVTLKDGTLTVVSPLEDTPAYRAGIMPGDRILKVDNKTTKDVTLDDAVKLMRGIPGTRVKLTIIRENENRLREFTIRRAVIKIKSIKEVLMLTGSIGYIKIAEFQMRTGRDLNKALRRLIKKGMEALILDLRNNPGGLLDASLMVAKEFLEKPAVIVSIKGRDEKEKATYRSKAFKAYTDFPVAVLVNRGSASASEIVAGALRDNKRAIIVGGKSFGKGSVQVVIPLRDGSAIRLTASYYYTPSGTVIHENGITPDIVVEEVLPGAEEDTGITQKASGREALMEDNQIKKAVELLRDNAVYTSLLEA